MAVAAMQTVDTLRRARENQAAHDFGHGVMLSKLKALWTGRAGEGADAADAPAAGMVEYNGYRIRPAPQRDGNQYRTAGTIEKDTAEGVKEHRFVRADVFPGRDDAIAFTIMKAKQIIDQQGDRIFK